MRIILCRLEALRIPRLAVGLIAAGSALAAAGAGSAMAAGRVALAIGEADHRHALVLATPKSDAAAIARLLGETGFGGESTPLAVSDKSTGERKAPAADKKAEAAPPPKAPDPVPAIITECDRIASSPDSVLPGLKVTPFSLLSPKRAVPACQDAVKLHPTETRLMGLLGRALHKAGRFDEARSWYEKAAAKGDKVSLNNLGSMYEGGQGVPIDDAKALDYYERAVEAGNAFSMRNIGRMHEYGLGMPVNLGLARNWYEASAQTGEPAGMYELGRLYQEGKGVPQDFAKALSWYEKAASKGYAPSFTGLGYLHETGRGVALDLAIARSWYEKAAEGGESTGTYNLARLVARGAGGPKDPQAAARHLLMAARLGSTAARNDLDGDMPRWDDDIRKAVLELLKGSGDYREGLWDRAAREASRSYYLRVE